MRAAAMAAVLAALGTAWAQDPPKTKAPELDGGKGWLNTDQPIKLADLKGKIVLLDFWTFCCINCHHVFPDLKRLERKYPKELVVIGVHSKKFPNEAESENIRHAVVRHDLTHPVVNDADETIFKAFGATGWPHFVLIDPDGNLYGRAGGEGIYALLDEHIAKLVKQFEGKLDRTEKVFTLEKSKEKSGALYYPCKLVATEGRLYIADTRHHRVLVADPAGKVLEVIGGPDEGRADGGYASARFSMPTGLALKGDTLWVADTENHLLREIDLAAKSVKTIAGTGAQVYNPEGRGDGLKTPLNSPWDLALDGSRLLIAMAGNHQIWAFDLTKQTVAPHSGTGREKIADGPHAKADYSQPSGISIAAGKVYVADSEISAVRETDLDPAGGVRTLVGTGLFQFGDVDGIGDKARLQHALGVHAHRGLIYVADSYNHKIKTVDPKTREVKTLFGDGKRGSSDQAAWPKGDGMPARFNEPSGLWAVGDRLYVADQNNHAIRVCDLKTGEVRTIALEKR
jgi:thiol-disulfide isomerase/thioredoxin